MLLWALACAPGGSEPLWTWCDPIELESGDVRAKRIACTDERAPDGEARRGEFLMHNALVTASFRSPGEALSVFGVGGGTLIDFAPADGRDRLIEAIPLIDGGWMEVQDWDFGHDDQGAWLRLAGEPRSVPHLPPIDEQGWVEVTWTLAPDTRTLQLQGADGLYLHGDRLSEPVPSGLLRPDRAWGTDATAMTDLGGAVVLDGVTQITTGSWEQVHDALYTVPVSGTCDGDQVTVWADDVLVARLPASFESVVPESATTLVCTGFAVQDGAGVAPGQDLVLTTGDAGGLWVRAVDPSGLAIPVVVVVDGQVWASRPEGEWLDVPPGVHDVTVSHGPVWSQWTDTLTLDGPTQLDVVLEPVIDTHGWAAVDLFRTANPAWNQRTEQLDDLALAAAQGVVFAVQSAPDELGEPYTNDWTAIWLRTRAGSETASPVGAVWSWPWTQDTRRGAHGAVDWTDLDAVEVLAVAADVGTPMRHTVVGTEWLDHAGDPAGWNPAPDLLRLTSLADLPDLIELLEQGQRVGVAGPVTWVPSPSAPPERLPARVELERPLVTGASVASTGPILALASTPSVEPLRLEIDARLAPEGIDQVALWVDGAVTHTWDGDQVPDAVQVQGRRWALLVAQGEDHWAVSAPLWLQDG